MLVIDLLDRIAARIFAEFEPSNKYRSLLPFFNESLFEIACVYGFQPRPVEIFRQELEMLDWQDKLKNPAPRVNYYRRMPTDQTWNEARGIAICCLRIAELLLNSQQIADFQKQCAAIRKEFYSWDMSGLYSNSLEADLLLLEARACLQTNQVSEARNLLTQSLALTTRHQPPDAARLLAYTLLCRLSIADGNLQDASEFAKSLIIATTNDAGAFNLPLPLWRLIYCTLLEVECPSDRQNSTTAKPVLDSWRLKLDESVRLLNKACPQWRGTCFYAEESHYARYAGEAFLLAASGLKGRRSFKRALRLAAKAGFVDPLFLAQCHAGIARSFDQTRQYAFAERRWRRAIELVGPLEAQKNNVFYCGMLRALSKCLEGMHRFIESIALEMAADVIHCDTLKQPSALQDWNIGDGCGNTPLLFQR